MNASWGDLNARARGLATHLATRPALEALAAAPDLVTFSRGCVTAGILPAEPEPVTAPSLELAFRRQAGLQLRRLARWMAARTALLAIVLEDEDRRSLRALMRGAVAGLAAETRLSGLLPTPGLSERMLEALAARVHVRDVVALLVAWQHPYGVPLLALAESDEPDLFRLECALNRTFATRASNGARHGDAALQRYVGDTLDQANLLGALVLAGQHLERPAGDAFLPGGRRLPLERFIAAATAESPAAVISRLADLFPPRLIARLRPHLQHPPALERALLRERIEGLNREARLEPLGPAPLLGYLLRLREESIALQTVTWGIALGAPVALRLREREVPA